MMRRYIIVDVEEGTAESTDDLKLAMTYTESVIDYLIIDSQEGLVWDGSSWCNLPEAV